MGVERPPWLDEEEEIRALLGAALDRFDRQRGFERERSFSFAVRGQLPSLARADAAADQTWSLVRELARRGVFGIRQAGRTAANPYDAEWTAARIVFVPEIEGTLRAWLGRGWTEPASLTWRRAIDRHASAFHDGGAALLAQRIVIANRSADEVIGALAAAVSFTAPLTLRQLSATLFWGDSKVLDERAELIAALLPRLSIRDRAVVIAVHIPASCHGVIFIENQDTYTAAAAGVPSAALDHALVYAAGFRGTAARVRNRSGALLHYAGAGGAALAALFDAWWFDAGAALGPTWFWGDLDFAGMQILKTLRERFVGLSAWQPGYAPLLARVGTVGGYGAIGGGEAGGQLDPGGTGCEYADGVLLPAIRRHGRMDQEVASG